MKDLVKRAKSFITFDFPIQVDYINTQFTNTHVRYQADFPGWSTNATKQKMISIYWLNHVLRHFSFMVGYEIPRMAESFYFLRKNNILTCRFILRHIENVLPSKI